MPIQNVCILGATGSIGVNTLDVISRHPDRYNVFALTANNNVEKLIELCQVHTTVYVALVCTESAERLSLMLAEAGLATQVLVGREALAQLAKHDSVDIVMAAIVGAAGLEPNLAAANAGKKILLANKESLVMAGEIFLKAVKESGATLLPIDSEHNAIYQSLPASYQCGTPLSKDIKRLLLTASGGPFRALSLEELHGVTPEQACKHPNWSMGQKISVDSASLMNKGLELIEACWLFGVSPEQVEVHIHPESIIHSLVEYIDGSVLSQMGNPDMRTPISYGLAWPERIASGAASLNLFDVGQLNFERPDFERFPCLTLASEAFNMGGTACAVLNAANEVAVASFLKGNIRFTSIPDIIRNVLISIPVLPADTLAVVIEADRQARDLAELGIRNIQH